MKTCSQPVPRVAVLMAVCNGLPWLKAQIETILQQVGVELHLYISIDKSTDQTAEYCKALEAKESRVHVMSGDGPGSPSGNFFRLMREVPLDTFEYIALSDQDDIWLEDKLLHGIECLKKECADAYSSSYTAFWTESGREVYVDKSAPQTAYDFLFESPGPGCSFILTPQLVQHVCKHLDVKVCDQLQQLQFHDWFIYAFARYYGYRWVIDTESRLRYRQHSHNVIGANYGLRALIKRIKHLIGGQWQGQIVLIADLIGMGMHPFVCKWRKFTPASYYYLFLNTALIRRKKRDRQKLRVILIIMAMISFFKK